MIEFQHIRKEYPDGTVAIHDLSFTIPDGRITVLVGPSGCGKTTSLRMINRLIEPTSGVILVDGHRSEREDARQLRRRMGYVIQSAGLFPHRTVIDNVAAVPVLLGTRRSAARAHALDVMDMVGLDRSFAQRYPWQLSGGQQQRVGIARALAADPPILLMDEPFSALDPVVRQQLQGQLLDIQASVAKTIVLVTHNVDEALRLGDQILILREGGILAQAGTPEELISHPASPFVANFLGSSRGYQSLAFAAPDGVQIDPVATLNVGQSIPAAGSARPDVSVVEQAEGAAGSPGPWHVVVDDRGAPLGWFRGEPGDVVTADAINYACSPVRQGEPLRHYLDSALSSPSGAGIVVDAEGAVVGTAHIRTITQAFETARAGR